MKEFPIFINYDTTKAPVGKVLLEDEAEKILADRELNYIIGPQVSVSPSTSSLIAFGLFPSANLREK